MELYNLIKPLGIASYILVFITVFSGIFIKYIPLKNKFKIHRLTGVAALIIATIHFLLVLKYI